MFILLPLFMSCSGLETAVLLCITAFNVALSLLQREVSRFRNHFSLPFLRSGNILVLFTQAASPSLVGFFYPCHPLHLTPFGCAISLLQSRKLVIYTMSSPRKPSTWGSGIGVLTYLMGIQITCLPGEMDTCNWWQKVMLQLLQLSPMVVWHDGGQ